MGFGQSVGLEWQVASRVNVTVTSTTAVGTTAEFAATLQDARSTLTGSYELTVTNSEGSSVSRVVSVSVENVPPAITVPGTTDGMLFLAVGQSTTRIDFEATDNVGVVTLTWTIVGDDNSDDSTVFFGRRVNDKNHDGKFANRQL